MPQSIDLTEGESLLVSLANRVDEDSRKEIIAAYDMLRFVKVFEDGDEVSVYYALFSNDLNIRLTARKLYMHRNTLIYRLNKLKAATGVDITTFSGAIIFIILHCFYMSGRGRTKERHG